MKAFCDVFVIAVNSRIVYNVELLVCCVRVNEQLVLLDAIKELLNLVSSTAAMRTTVNNVINCLMSQSNKTHNKSVVTASDHCSPDDKMVPNIAENTLISDTSSVGQNTRVEDGPSESGCRGDAADAEVVGSGEVGRSADDAECSWKLFIKVEGRTKHISRRYRIPNCLLMLSISLAEFSFVLSFVNFLFGVGAVDKATLLISFHCIVSYCICLSYITCNVLMWIT